MENHTVELLESRIKHVECELFELKKQLKEHSRRFPGLERAIVAQEFIVTAAEKNLDNLLKNTDRQADRLTQVRDLLGAHEQRESDKGREDLKYRVERERDDRRARVALYVAVGGILSTLGAVVLQWALTNG